MGGQGASTPAGSTAQVPEYGKVAASAAQVRRNNAEVKLIGENARISSATAGMREIELARKIAEAKLMDDAGVNKLVASIESLPGWARGIGRSSAIGVGSSFDKIKEFFKRKRRPVSFKRVKRKARGAVKKWNTSKSFRKSVPAQKWKNNPKPMRPRKFNPSY